MSRKTDEYDINNVVGDIVGAKYVERALHEDINTPSVRVVTTFTMSVEELRRLNNMDAALRTLVLKTATTPRMKTSRTKRSLLDTPSTKTWNEMRACLSNC